MASPLVQALSFQQNTAHPAQSGISPTDVLGAYSLAANMKQKEYEAKIAQQNAKFGGMAQLGGAAILAGGPTAYSKLFGAGAKTAADAAAPGVVSGAAPAVPWAPSSAGLPWPTGGTALADNSVLPITSTPTMGGPLAGTPAFGSGATAASAPVDAASLATPTAYAAPTVAEDIAAASSPVDAAGGLFSSVFGPAAGLGSAGAGTVASDLAAAAPAAGAAGDVLAAGGAAAGAGGIADALASAGLPDWLASILPFLAAA